MTWTTVKPTQTGWYWYRKDPGRPSMVFYCGTVWDHLVDFAGLNEPIAFVKDHLLEGEWAGPLEPPSSSPPPSEAGLRVSKSAGMSTKSWR